MYFSVCSAQTTLAWCREASVLCEAGKAVWVRVWGVWFVSGECYLQVSVVAGNCFEFLWRST